MNEMPSVVTERVDDIPLLVAQMRRMELPSLIDSYFVVHGNRQGLSVGWTATVWLAHILSQADHRLNQVQPWAERRLATLRGSTDRPVAVLDLTDDRLAAVLRTLADDAAWVCFERALGRTGRDQLRGSAVHRLDHRIGDVIGRLAGLEIGLEGVELGLQGHDLAP